MGVHVASVQAALGVRIPEMRSDISSLCKGAGTQLCTVARHPESCLSNAQVLHRLALACRYRHEG